MRKLFALLLAVCLLAACFPAMAAEEEEAPAAYGALSGIATNGEVTVVADTWYKVLWQIDGEDLVLLAGSLDYRELTGESIADYHDDVPEHARFMEPWAVVPFLDGWAVSDAAANAVRYVTEKSVTTAAGNGKAGFQDGFCTKALLNRPAGLAVDDEGILYIADSGNGAIRKLDTKGNLTTVIKGLSEPTGLCWFDGALYVTETGTNRILKIKDKEITVLAGGGTANENGVYEGGYRDGPAANALFRAPQGILVAEDGTVYVSDTANAAIRKIRNGTVTTFADPADCYGALEAPRGLMLQDDVLLCVDTFTCRVIGFDTQAVSYPDVNEADWFAEDVLNATERGLFNGTGNGFQPELSLSRSMFVTLLSRIQKNMDRDVIIDGDTAFSDLAEDSWYAAAARWAADTGIVLGIDGAFCGDQDISREQLVTMLFRFAEAYELDNSARAELDAFSDAEDCSDWAAEALSWAVACGLLNGADGALMPGDGASRAQAAAILNRFLARYEI